MKAEFGGETLEFLSGRAIHWPAGRVLLIADLHLGKASAWLARGIPIPDGATSRDLAMLSTLLASVRAQRLIVLGDLVHGRESFDAETTRRVSSWRCEHAALAVDYVSGNHDMRAGELPPAWNIGTLGAEATLGPFALRHDPPEATSRVPTLCGHLHPGIRLRGAGTRGVRLPCFWLRENVCVLPAFSAFTGLATIRPGKGDRVFAIVNETVVEPGSASTSAI